MVYFKYGGKRGKRFSLGESKDLVVVRTRRPAPLSRIPISGRAQQILAELTSVEPQMLFERVTRQQDG